MYRATPKMKSFYKKSAVVLTAGAFTVPAFALDTTEIVSKITGIGTATDAVGGAFVSVAVGMVVFGFIIGMIFRKGR